MNDDRTGKGALPPASLVVVSYNSATFLPGCLRSLLALDYPCFDVTVVDNASVDGSADLVAREFPTVKLVRSPQNLGYSGGANIGFRKATGEIVVLLNPDVELRPDCLRELVRPMLGNDRVGAVGCKILYPDKRTLQHAGGEPRFPLALPWHRGYGEIDDGQYDTPEELDYVTGAVLAIRRRVLEELDYFDEGFNPVYFEDTDFCFRVRQAGYKIVYAPQAVATHHESSTVEQQSHTYFRYFHRSRLRFVAKHYRLGDLLQGFYPAESERLAGTLRPLDRKGSMEVYRESVKALAKKAGVTLESQEGATGMESPAEGTGQVELGQWQALRQHVKEVNDRWLVKERPFTSGVPGVGKVIVYLRDRLNRVATKWYIQPILQQQVDYNFVVSRTVEEMARQMENVDGDLKLYTAVVGERLALLEEKMDRRFGQIDEKLTRLEGLLGERPRAMPKKKATTQETPDSEAGNG